MSRLATSFVLGYHGCSLEVAEEVVSKGIHLKKSENSFDWLGSGIYFWENDPKRALEWSKWNVSRGKYNQAAVVGAVIDLRNCLDLSNREDLEIIKLSFKLLDGLHKISGLPLPANKNSTLDPNGDLLFRNLDCAVINFLHNLIESNPEFGKRFTDKGIEPFDTVRGVFTEGTKLYPDAGIYAKTHTQIAVRNLDCIKGYFRPI